MIIHDRCFCDICAQFLGQLWNQPAQAPDLLPRDSFRVCDECFTTSEVVSDASSNFVPHSSVGA
jgi:hypothetical protein